MKYIIEADVNGFKYWVSKGNYGHELNGLKDNAIEYLNELWANEALFQVKKYHKNVIFSVKTT